MNTRRETEARRQTEAGRETEERPAARGQRISSVVWALWMSAVLLAFLMLRILQSQSAHNALSWWKAR
jgi:hypothetical protein